MPSAGLTRRPLAEQVPLWADQLVVVEGPDDRDTRRAQRREHRWGDVPVDVLEVGDVRAGVSEQPLSHEEVIEAGRAAAEPFARLLGSAVGAIHAQTRSLGG